MYGIRERVGTDMNAIANARRDSLETICLDCYPADVIADCILPITPDRHRKAELQTRSGLKFRALRMSKDLSSSRA